MKKTLITLSKVFLTIALLFLGSFFAYKSITKNNLENKLENLNGNWTELIKLQEEKNNILKVLINNIPPNIQYSDSLYIHLTRKTYNKKNIDECSPELVYQEYLSNKYMLPLIKFYTENEKTLNDQEKESFKKIQFNLENTNKVIEKYNLSVKDYNSFYSSFPNFLIAKSYNFKRKNYFEIQFGVENLDPKIVKKERRDWQRKIEMEHGLSE